MRIKEQQFEFKTDRFFPAFKKHQSIVIFRKKTGLH